MTFIGVCGGRAYHRMRTVFEVLNREVPADGVVVHGDAAGADALADKWAHEHARHIVRVPAMWNVNGNAAGPIRNAVIAAMPLAKLIAFPGGRGTADMVAKAKARGIPVVEVP